MEADATFGPYPDGRGQAVYADPLAADLAIRESLGCDPNDVVKQTQSPEPRVAAPARRRLLAAVRVAFGLAPFDPVTGKGATDRQAADLWNRWADFFGRSGGAGGPSPTSPPPASSPSLPDTLPPLGSGVISTASDSGIPS